MSAQIRLYSMSRNSAGWRVRIALALKGVPYEYVSRRTLRPDDYARINPQGLLPALEIDGQVVAQSGAILELLEELHPTPSLFPEDPVTRAQARAFGQLIACDMHPLNNNRVRKYLAERMRQPQTAIDAWVAHWIERGLTSLEQTLEARAGRTRFAFSDTPGFAELHLIPQLYNCRRAGLPLEAYPRLVDIDGACRQIEAFRAAAPERMSDFTGEEPRWL